MIGDGSGVKKEVENGAATAQDTYDADGQPILKQVGAKKTVYIGGHCKSIWKFHGLGRFGCGLLGSLREL